MSNILLGVILMYALVGVIIAHIVFITPQRREGTGFNRAYNNVKVQGLVSEYLLCLFAWLPFVIYVLTDNTKE